MILFLVQEVDEGEEDGEGGFLGFPVAASEGEGGEAFVEDLVFVRGGGGAEVEEVPDGGDEFGGEDVHVFAEVGYEFEGRDGRGVRVGREDQGDEREVLFGHGDSEEIRGELGVLGDEGGEGLEGVARGLLAGEFLEF